MSDQAPKAAFFAPEEVALILRRAARAMAVDINSGLEWKDDGDQWLFNFFLNGLGRGDLSSMEVKLNSRKMAQDTEQYYQMFCQNFVQFATTSPAFAIKYIQEKHEQARRCWQNMSYKFSSARQVNNEIVRELNRSLHRTFQVKVGSEIAAAFVGSFLPVNWIANTVIGVSYTIITEVITNVSDVSHADILSWQTAKRFGRPAAIAASGAYGNYVQKVTGEADEAEAILLREAEAAAAKKHAEFQRILERAANKTANKATRREVELAARRVQNATNRLGQATVNAGGAKALAFGAKVASFGASLLFMKDDINAAFIEKHEYSDR